jgi:NAD(P)-dependent dehydrogenase (short-subunit alcohol dehydrogenase family)
MTRFSNSVVVITGAAGILGTAAASAFRAEGARLVLVDRHMGALREAFGSWPETLLLEADLTSEADTTSVVESTVAETGALDVLLNIAGGFRMGARLHETSLEDWEFMLQLNARTVFLMSRAALRQMLVQEGGKIVSVSARAGISGGARMAPYSVSKGAVIRLTECIAAEYKNDGIQANCIVPSVVDTPANREDMPDADFTKWVTPEAVAEALLFLASDAAGAINGAAVPVYGRV